MAVPNAVYRLKNVLGGTYLDADGAQRGVVHGWSSYPASTNQQWRVQHVGGHFYVLQVLSSNLYLSAKGTKSGKNRVIVSEYPTRWTLKRCDGAYILLAEDSNSAVDLDSGRSQDGTTVNLWSDASAVQQRWFFEKIGESTGHVFERLPGGYSGALPLGIYKVTNQQSHTALDLAAGAPGDGVPVTGYQPHGGDNQKWVLEGGDRGYRIRNLMSGTYLSIPPGGKPHVGLPLIGNRHAVEWDIRRSNKNDDKAFEIFYVDDEYHLVVDLYGGDKGNSTKVSLWDNNNGDNQNWNFDRQGDF